MAKKQRGLRSSASLQSPIPPAFLASMERLLGDEYPAFRATYDLPPRSGLRVNTLKISPEEFARLAPWPLEPLPWPAGAFLIPDEAQPGAHSYHLAGLYYLQDPSAMVPAALLDPQPGDYVLDLSAAPGGKATHLASLLGGSGLLVANEIHPQRAWVLAENLERWGARNAAILNETPERIAAAFPEFFDRVLVDAPCSGEGMFRKSEAARRDWTPQLVAGCAARQDGILDEAAAALRPGGILAYVTCTFAPEEDEGSVARFLAAHPDFVMVPAAEHPGFAPGRPDWLASHGQPQPSRKALRSRAYDEIDTGPPQGDRPDAGIGDDRFPSATPRPMQGPGDRVDIDLSRAVRLWPNRFPGEGHFIALLQKSENGRAAGEQVEARPDAPDITDDGPHVTSGEGRRTRRGTGHAPRPSHSPASRAHAVRERGSTGRAGAARRVPGLAFSGPRSFLDLYLAFCAEHLTDVPAEERLAMVGTYLYQVPPGLEELELAAVRAIHPGWWLGVFKKERFEPSHALALALRVDEARQSLDLVPDGPEAAAYLRGETVRSAGDDGWVLVTTSGYSLGWARRVAGVLKSHYPRGLRRP